MAVCPRISGSIASVRQRRFSLLCLLAVCSILVVTFHYFATTEQQTTESERKLYGAKDQTRKALGLSNAPDTSHNDISAANVEFVASTEDPTTPQKAQADNELSGTSYKPLTNDEIYKFKKQVQRLLTKNRRNKTHHLQKMQPLYYPSTAPSRSPPITAASNENNKNYYVANLDQAQVPVYVPASNPQYRALEVSQSEQNPLQANPFIPAHRLVHFDLKGAPPLMSYLRKVIPFVAKLGATGLMIEWEDTFPFEGPLASIAASNHYTKAEVQEIISLAKKHSLEIVPLVQTFGHLEFVLKGEKWSALRENPQVPQAICPSRNESLDLVEMLIDQVMALHTDIKYLHIGCDEVFHMGECNICSRIPRDDLFLGHVTRVARYVRDTYNVTPIIWDDMMRQMSVKDMMEAKLGELVEPMVWVYAENVYYFVSPSTWQRYEQVFPAAWGSSAFKGAFGETLLVPNVRRHVDNNLKWLEVAQNESPKFKEGFRGLALAGWQRYDHFANLCELLPAGIPSLTLILLTTSNGYFDAKLTAKFDEALGCVQSSRYSSGALNLDTDKFLYDHAAYCNFPGSSFFKLTGQLIRLERDVEAFMKSVRKNKAWLTEYNVRRNFSSPARLDEVTRDLPYLTSTANSLARVATQSMADIFDDFTISEWLEQKILPLLNQLKQVDEDVASMKQRRHWPARPLPMFKEWDKYGIAIKSNEKSSEVVNK